MPQKLSPFSNENSQVDDRLWSEYYPKLQRYCRFLTQNTWDGDDIAQETYLKALKYSQQQMSSALLNKIAYHHWIDLLRKRKKVMVDDADIDNSIHEVTTQLDEMSHAVNLLLTHFTPKQAVIFMLKEAFQYQLKEIAELLNTTEMAVKASLHRVKKRLEKDDHSYSADLFWDQEEREQLSNIFYDALKNQDPTVLIQSIPSLTSISEVPKLVLRNLQPLQTYSPSSTLCMAA
ncbi:sigma-70 family RNA polymerase sigma factor [Neobacillus vireti]|uniref:RNA polymerase factor sigma-70 n=1 Tax=Neobacillus vireti LMG 21834 TaxID=1131730 RepID=A0AB94IU29_9BACI|nr:sigma-70 family RNA polymerase sigma factor [Neobacillus vireti]ETI70463.1 RNA polymerase factor sigma-70 [Neobacillus vireti LMG 21834]KLT19880.1 RNA polymerase sigma factor SigY [Neobacillus vireti]